MSNSGRGHTFSGEEPDEVDIHSDEDLPENLLPDLSSPSQHALPEGAESPQHEAEPPQHDSVDHVASMLDPATPEEIVQHLSADLHALTSQLHTDPEKGRMPDG